jgi:hypothetical protein
MSPPVDLEAALPLSFSSSARVRNALTFCAVPCFLVTTCIRMKHVIFLILTFSLFLGLYLFDQLPLSFDTTKLTLFPFSASQDDNSSTILEKIDLPPISCNFSPTLFFYPINSSNFYLELTPADPVPDTAVRRIVAQEAVSNECLEQWVETGTWTGACLSLKLKEPRIDLVWTWVNGR